ncbi:MAG: hypothetical protein ACE5FO_05590 [Parvularculaceae bacterium]
MFVRILLAALAAGAIGSAAAQTEQLKKLQPELQKRLPLPQLELPGVLGENSDAALRWVSPLLLNAPGTIGGERYSIDGKRFRDEFGFSIINPSAEASVEGGIDCYDASGVRDPKYSTRYRIEPMNAKQWRSDRAVPEPTTDGHMDKDEAWCVIWASAPVFAFGVRYTEVGSDRNADGFNLLAAAR